ncbi:MAG: ornithine cyclodeaminase family protein [Candidatus Korarchaeota archaeon]|nr:ornithine cyclodeaminase family protein [Candidatus Korarchaeota archaeon]
MLLLRPDDVREAIESDIRGFLDTLKSALVEKSSGKGWYPSRPSTNLPRGWIGFMPAYSEELGAVAVKIVGVFPENPSKGLPTVPASVLLIDAETGIPLSLMDGTVITEYRTGGASALSAEVMAREDSETLLIIGAGTQGRSHSRLIPEVRPIKRVFVRDVDRARAGSLADWLRRRGLDAKVVTENRHADIIATVTTSKKPVLLGRDLARGTHVCAVGAYTPDARELDDTAITSFDRIVVDTADALQAGDLKIPLERGLIPRSRVVGELGEVLAGLKIGRASSNEITLYKSVGTSALDVAAAFFVYKRAEELRLGREVDLSP